MSHLSLVPQSDQQIREYIEEFILDRKIARRSPRTIEWYEEKLSAFGRWLTSRGVQTLQDVEASQVRRFLGEISNKGFSDATLHGYARAVRAFLNWCAAEGYAEKVRITMPKVEEKRPKILSADDIKCLFNACLTERDKALLLTLADTGLRASECMSLTWGDISLEDGVIRVRKTKNRKWRVVMLGAKSRRALLRYRRCVPHEPNDPLWLSQREERLTRAGLTMLFKRLSNRAGINASPHDFRRWFAVHSLRGGMGLEHLRRLLGHSNFSIILKYVELLESDLRDAHDASGPVDTWFGKG